MKHWLAQAQGCVAVVPLPDAKLPPEPLQATNAHVADHTPNSQLRAPRPPVNQNIITGFHECS